MGLNSDKRWSYPLSRGAGNVFLHGRQKGVQFRWQLAFQSNLFSGARMRQFQLSGMQEISRQRNRAALVCGAAAPGPHLLWRAVESVADYRMAERSHVDTNLMRAAGIDFHFDQRELAKGSVQATDDAVVRDGFAASRAARGHPDAADRVAADRRVDGSAIFLRPAVHQRDISLLHFALGKLLGQLAMRFVVFRYDDQSAGFFVEAVDDARPQLPAHGRQRREVMQQGVDQGAAIALVSRLGRRPAPA